MHAAGAGTGGPGEHPPAAGEGGASAAGGSPLREARGRAVIPNPEGMHARPCHALVSLIREHSSEVRVACQGREVSGHSILELMTLAAACGTELAFVARGPDAPELVERLVSFVGSGFAKRG